MTVEFADPVSEEREKFHGTDPVNLQQDEERWEVIVRFNGDIEKIAAEMNAEAEVLYQNYAILTLKRDKIRELYAYPQIEHERPRRKHAL